MSFSHFQISLAKGLVCLTATTQVFSPAKVTFEGTGVLLQVEKIPDLLFLPEIDTEANQPAKDISAAQEALIDIFARIENLFKRLETYTEVRPNVVMADIIVKITVEVLNILGIATKEIKRGRTSELSIPRGQYSYRFY
ncbi:hypothetical protein EI94DRAFT_1699715 [Lactarius quietus]|nr:hypothetical protein EI94DRAFT_1699715 [Lactarius quietus]